MRAKTNGTRFTGLCNMPSVATALFFAILGGRPAPSQQANESALIQRIDASVQYRLETIAGYTVTEHYAVYRGADQVHPAAEMTVETTYRRESGKSYAILSESGSEILRRFVLHPLLNNEKSINLPGNREHSWFSSANYEMTLKPGVRRLDGRDCFGLALTPKRKAPNMIDGTLWIDDHDAAIVRIEGVASKSPTVWSGPPTMMRQYTPIDGFAMPTHARAESESFFFGRTAVTIDYSNYRIQLRPAP